ncbi:MAG: hypothetical protein C4558_06290, partial [Dehalococcoidia bacterium]
MGTHPKPTVPVLALPLDACELCGRRRPYREAEIVTVEGDRNRAFICASCSGAKHEELVTIESPGSAYPPAGEIAEGRRGQHPSRASSLPGIVSPRRPEAHKRVANVATERSMNVSNEDTALAVAGEQKRVGFSLEPKSLSEAIELAKIMAGSDLVPKDFREKPGNVLVAVQMGAEVGLAPMQAIQNIAIINGRPAVWGDACLALVKASGLLVMIDESDDGSAATCVVQRRGEPNTVSRSFSMEDAKTAGLLSKDGPWRTYPRRMRQMRARAWALRDVFPDVLRGLAVREEVEDIDVTPAVAPVSEDRKSV